MNSTKSSSRRLEEFLAAELEASIRALTERMERLEARVIRLQTAVRALTVVNTPARSVAKTAKRGHARVHVTPWAGVAVEEQRRRAPSSRPERATGSARGVKVPRQGRPLLADVDELDVGEGRDGQGLWRRRPLGFDRAKGTRSDVRFDGGEIVLNDADAEAEPRVRRRKGSRKLGGRAHGPHGVSPSPRTKTCAGFWRRSMSATTATTTIRLSMATRCELIPITSWTWRSVPRGAGCG